MYTSIQKVHDNDKLDNYGFLIIKMCMVAYGCCNKSMINCMFKKSF